MVTPVVMIPTRHYRQIAPGDRVYGGGQCVGVRSRSVSWEFITYHPLLKKYRIWPREDAVHLHGYYEAEQ